MKETIERSELVTLIKENQQQSFFKKALKLYVPSQLGNFIGDASPKDAQAVVTNWLLNKDKPCLLLLGDSGAGKTLFGQWLTQFIFDNSEQFSNRIPLFIPLLVHNPGEGLLDRYLKKTCELNKIERRWLKQQPLLLILDGFDELYQKINIYRSNEWWQLKDVKIIISCRSQWLNQVDNYQKLFCPYDKNEQALVNKIQEQVVSPFTSTQRDSYMEQYVKLNQNKIKKRYPNTQENWLTWQTYQKYLEKLPSLRDVLHSPFVLSLVMHVLPKAIMDHQDKEHVEQLRLARINLYDHFVEQWFARQKVKLLKGRHIDEHCPVEEIYVLYSKKLAGAMLHANVTSVDYVPEKPSHNFSQVIEQSKKKALFTIIEDYQHGYQANNEAKNPWEIFFSDEEVHVGNNKLKLSLIRAGCPLMKLGQHSYAFLHKSLLEYFSARELFEGLVSEASIALGYELNEKLLIDEPATLKFIAEKVKQDKGLEQRLFAVIEESKYESRVEIASSNAITILNYARVSLSGKNLKRVRIKQADLSGALLDGTDLRESDLRQVNLQGAWLKNAKLGGSLMRSVFFGERPYIKMKEKVKCIAYDANGTLLVAAVLGYDVLVYRNEGHPVLIGTFKGHTKAVESVAFSADGKFLASGSKDRSVWLWDLKRQRPLGKLTGHRDNVSSVAFSADGRFLASGSWDKRVRLWNVASQQPLAELKGRTREITSVAFSMDGRFLAAGSSNHSVQLWNVESQQPLGELTGHANVVTSVAFSVDGRFLASGSWDQSVRLWDVESQQPLGELTGHMCSVESVAFSADGRFLASGSEDKSIRLWDVESQQPLGELTGHTGSVRSVAFSMDGRFLASGSKDRSVRLWDVKSQRPLGELTGHRFDVTSVAFSADGRFLASGGSAYDGMFNPNRGDNSVRLWEAESGRLLGELKGHTGYVTSVAFSTDGRFLASGSLDNSVRLWDVKSQQPLGELKGHTDDVTSVAFSTDGRFLISGSDDKSVRLWDVASQRSLGELKGHRDDVTSVASSTDGRFLASGSKDKSVRLWSVASQQPLGELTGHTGSVESVAFSADGRFLASSSSAYGGMLDSNSGDKSVRLWDVKSQQPLGELTGHTESVTSVAFSMDGRFLASGSEDNSVRLWEVEKQTLLQCVFMTHEVSAVSFCYNPSLNKTLLGVASGNDLYCFALLQKDNQVNVQLLWGTGEQGLQCDTLDLGGVIDLEEENLQLLAQRGGQGKGSQKNTEKIVEERKERLRYDPKNPPYDLCEHKHFITPNTPRVSLMRKKEGQGDTHVFLVIERIDSGCYTFTRADLFLDQRKEVQKGRFITTGEALVEICEKPLFEIEALLEQGCVYKSWQLSLEQVEQLVCNLEQDRVQRLNYVNVGKQSFFAKKKTNQHSCLTWCEEHLERIGVDVSEQKSFLDVIVAHPKRHLPNKKVKDFGEINSFGNEPNTKGCIVM